jgi:myosin heavy subunit
MRNTPGRKRKLDHLTYDEKVQRKKLKNRVAAQTSRDRKKKQMEEMMVTIEKQAKEISQWEHRYNQLKTKYDKLDREVAKLKQAANKKEQAASTRHSIPEEHKYTRRSSHDDEEKRCEDSSVGSEFIKPKGSAVSMKPLPKVKLMKSETTEQSPVNSPLKKKKNDVQALLKVIMLCLLYKNSSMASTSNAILKSLQSRLSPISAQTWRSILQQAIAQMPKKTAENANCLDQWWASQRLGPENHEWNPIAIEAH